MPASLPALTYVCNLTDVSFVAEQPLTLYLWFIPNASDYTTLNIPVTVSTSGYFSDPAFVLQIPLRLLDTRLFLAHNAV